jgi:hypothetical protein
MQAVIHPFLVGAETATEDLISTIQISPLLSTATISARRPDGSGNSLTQQKSSERNNRPVPRAIARAVSDCRPSPGG